MNAARREKGFTLIEVMAAVGILAISLVALLGLRNRDVQMQEEARSMTQATLLARQMLTETGITGAPELGHTEGDFGDRAKGFRWQRDVNTFMIELVREVRVTVLWGPTDRVEMSRFVVMR